MTPATRFAPSPRRGEQPCSLSRGGSRIAPAQSPPWTRSGAGARGDTVRWSPCARRVRFTRRHGDCVRLRRGSARLPAAGLLLFACPKRGSQEKGHPDGALSGPAARKARGWAAGFFDGAPAPTKNWPASVPPPLRADPPPTRRAIGAPKSSALPARTSRARCTGVRTANRTGAPFDGMRDGMCRVPAPSSRRGEGAELCTGVWYDA